MIDTSHTGSDLLGRTTAFNATLFLTSLFGVLASFANTFILLCIALFFLGSAVGVSSRSRPVCIEAAQGYGFVGIDADGRHSSS